MIPLGPAAIRLRPAWLLGLWGGATWLVLQGHDLSMPRDLTICGPWGCGPTIPALASAHGFWLMVLLPAAWLARARLGPRGATAAGWACVGFGAAGIAATLVVESRSWLASGNPGLRAYLPQHLLFTLATTVQVPLVPALLAGLILLWGRGSRPVPQVDPYEAGSPCTTGACQIPATLDPAPASGPIEIGRPLPVLTLVARDGAPLFIPEAARGRSTLLYFMRAVDCSICRGHVHRLAGHFGKAPGEIALLIVHPAGPRRSSGLAAALPPGCTILSARGTGAYAAVGLAGRNFGLMHGSGTILVDPDGIVRHASLASLPFQALREPDLLAAVARVQPFSGGAGLDCPPTAPAAHRVAAR